MLINYFFGTTINAAYAVGTTIANYVNTFVGNFDSASAPQIIQNVSSGNKERSLELAFFTCRICTLLMLLLYFPFISNIDFILHLWLGDNVPLESDAFCRYTLLSGVVAATSGGVAQLVNSVGNIKWFKIWQSILYLSCLPGGYILFSHGFSGYYIMLLFVISDLVYRVIQVLLLRSYFNFSVVRFVREAYIRPALIFIILSFLTYAYGFINRITIFEQIVGFIISLVVTSFIIFYVGLKKTEREKVAGYIRKKL